MIVKTNPDAALLIVEDEEAVCGLLADLAAGWGMRAACITEPVLDEDWIREIGPDVCLLDLELGSLSGLDLIPLIRSVDAECRIIIVTGFAQKGTAIQALRLGAFDIIEKPFDKDLLLHAVMRALEAREKDRSLRRLVDDLRRSEQEQMKQRVELERLNERLIETHEAFLGLARSMEAVQREASRKVLEVLNASVLPVLTRLAADDGLALYRLELESLSKIVRSLTEELEGQGGSPFSLSVTELRVASLIKSGFSTEEIAAKLLITPNTVRAHRRNIRKKLKLERGGHNLKNYLMNRI